MLPFRRILFPIDYSEQCLAVIPYVKEMARHFSAELTIVHAYGGEALAHSSLPLTNPEIANEAQAFEDRRLRDFAQTEFPGQHVEVFAQLGEAMAVIHNIVQRQGTDLVMLPTHGRGPVRRLLFGSVTAKVLHDLSTAVWTGTGTALAGRAPQVPYKSVICAVDESEEAKTVATAAATLACAYQAQLTLVQVLPLIVEPLSSLATDLTSYRKALLDGAHMRLRELKGELNISAPHAVIEGMVADGVREEAIRRKADLIVAGRGRSQATVSRMWSHLYQIIRESPCPVLSI